MSKILLVEDDNNLREIYEARLQAEGYTIVSAMDGEEALVVAKKEKPDLIISDVMMPRISGFEMLDILRNTDGLKEVKVIMLTALGQAEDKVRADSLGADRYLVKSQVTLEDIVKAAQELLEPQAQSSPPTAETPVTAGPSVAPVPAQTPPVTSDTPLTAPQQQPTPSVEPPAISTIAPVTPPVPSTPTAAAPIQPEPTSVSTTPDTPDEQPPASVPTPTTPPQPPVTTPPVQEPPAVPATQSEPEQSTPATEEPATADTSPTAPVESTSTASEAQSVSDEEAAIKAQIESFVNQNSQTAPNANPSSEKIMANAIKDLVSDTGTTPQPATPTVEKVIQPPTPQAKIETEPQEPSSAPDIPTTVAPPVVTPTMPTQSEPIQAPALTTATSQAPTNDSVSISGKKIIRPISTEVVAAPNLDELLAKEGFTNLDDMSSETPSGTTQPLNVSPQSTQPTSSDLQTAPHPPGHVISPNNGVDPNSIAL